MGNGLKSSAKTTAVCVRDTYIPAFAAIPQRYGFRIEVRGCVTLRPSENHSNNVTGVVELDDQLVPILDFRENTAAEITDLCCIVLFENQVGATTIVSGRLYENACQVYDLIVEHMDHPDTQQGLYSPSKNVAS